MCMSIKVTTPAMVVPGNAGEGFRRIKTSGMSESASATRGTRWKTCTGRRERRAKTAKTMNLARPPITVKTIGGALPSGGNYSGMGGRR